VHRLDKDTRGLLRRAKNERAMRSLGKAVAGTSQRADSIHADRWGRPEGPEGMIEGQHRAPIPRQEAMAGLQGQGSRHGALPRSRDGSEIRHRPLRASWSAGREPPANPPPDQCAPEPLLQSAHR